MFCSCLGELYRTVADCPCVWQLACAYGTWRLIVYLILIGENIQSQVVSCGTTIKFLCILLGICRIKYYRSVSYIPCVWQLTCANSLGFIISCITWLIWYLCYLFQVNNLEIHLSLVLGNDTGQLINAYFMTFGTRSELVGRACYRSNILTIKIYFCCQLSGICIEIVDHQTDILAASIQTCNIHLVELANMQVRQHNHFLPVQYIQCITWINWWYWRSRKNAAAEVDIQLIYQTDVIIHLAVANGLFCQTY